MANRATTPALKPIVLKSAKKPAAKKAAAKKPKRAVRRIGWHRVRLFQLKITLMGSEPAIWRRIMLRDDFVLTDLHHILQVVMGWHDCHLHQWLVPPDGKLTQRSLREASYYAPPGMELDETEDADATSLSEVLAEPEQSIVYEYDMGDSWQHEVTLEKVLDFDGKTDVRCLTGERACPPEDSGGVYGFYTQLEARNDPKHPDHADITEWIGDFDEMAFDADAVNRELAKGGR